jgi:hypothetical protein
MRAFLAMTSPLVCSDHLMLTHPSSGRRTCRSALGARRPAIGPGPGIKRLGFRVAVSGFIVLPTLAVCALVLGLVDSTLIGACVLCDLASPWSRVRTEPTWMERRCSPFSIPFWATCGRMSGVRSEAG